MVTRVTVRIVIELVRVKLMQLFDVGLMIAHGKFYKLV